jgi:DNA-binding transcriptional ArsR family regulator
MQPTVSRQLAILRAAELVRAERQGTRIRYSLCRSPFLNYPLDRFLSEIVPFFPELAADIAKLVDFKGDCVDCGAQDHEAARPGLV